MVQRYDKLLCGSWDLGIFTSLFNNTLERPLLHGLPRPLRPFPAAGAVYLAFYATLARCEALLVLQSAATAAAAWPPYVLVREVSGKAASRRPSRSPYLLYPFLGAGTLFDFHILSLSPFFFFWMLYFMVKRRWSWYAVSMLLLLWVKQSEAILVLGAGLYLLTRKEYIAGAITCAAAFAWGYLAMYVLSAGRTGQAVRTLDQICGARPDPPRRPSRRKRGAPAILYCLRMSR